MYKKIFLLVLIVTMITMTSCANRRDVPPDRQQGKAPQEQPKEDKLAKSEEEAVEENINGMDFEDDLKITEFELKEENKISFLNEQQKEEILRNIEANKINTVLEVINSKLPQSMNNTVKYTEYDMAFDYFLVTEEEGAEVRKDPKADAVTIAKIENLDKVTLLQRVEGGEFDGEKIWYRVSFQNGGEIKEGYLPAKSGTPRNFRFDEMEEAINELKQQLAEGELHFISNYKNQNGAPPQEGDRAVDEHGYRAYHSAPAYDEANINSNYRYIPDGMLVRILDETDDFYHINAPTFDGDFYVPKQYVDPSVTLSQLDHVIVVDRTQQNQAAFEVNGNDLNLVSYTLSTTGFPGEFSFETTLGSYKAIQKRDRFEYLKSGTQEIAGYAPFAIRFTGGAYIHGVPVAYEEENGEKVDPGTTEYLHTIGTFPRSSMCVRNFTSHAKFLHSWMNIENAAVIVIE